jgi:hypothetical protein
MFLTFNPSALKTHKTSKSQGSFMVVEGVAVCPNALRVKVCTEDRFCIKCYVWTAAAAQCVHGRPRHRTLRLKVTVSPIPRALYWLLGKHELCNWITRSYHAPGVTRKSSLAICPAVEW